MTVTALWSSYLPAARWFQGKGLPLRGMELTACPWQVEGPDLWVRSELARVDVGSTKDTYHLLVGYARPGTVKDEGVLGTAEVDGLGAVEVVDAPRSPQTMRAFLRAACRPGAPGIDWQGSAPDAEAPVRLLTGEQSHTSVVIGDAVLLKLYRRLTDGASLEAEVLSDLARQDEDAPAAGPGLVPGLVGVWRTPDGATDLGLFQQLVPQARDGYEYAVQACQADQSLFEPMAALGDRLAGLHARLRDLYGTSSARSGQLAEAVSVRLAQACDELPALTGLRPGLEARLAVPDVAEPLQRVHGDFHLGQTLLGEHGWVVIDFEGEPLKTPQERRAPDSVWRDVAGLLRSLDYARHTRGDPDSPDARAWLADARAGFLAGYLGRADLAGSPLLPVYEIDKAVYELRYETRNRPDWIGTPLQALREAAARGEDRKAPNP